MRTLEAWLGAPLFHRGRRGKVRLALTEAAERALPDIQAGFERLALGMGRLQESGVDSDSVLTVTVSPAFAAKWLLPRIERFQVDCSSVDVRLDTSHKPVDFAVQGVDIGVRYGPGRWPGLVAEKLMEEEVYPVCSPRLLHGQWRPRSPRDLARETLIHDLSMEGHRGFPTWDTWFRKIGQAGVDIRHGMQINNSAAVLQAAINAQGVALARSVMVHDDIISGRLVRLFPEVEYTSALAYYVVYRPECASLPRLKAFRDWLFTEVGRDSVDGGSDLIGT